MYKNMNELFTKWKEKQRSVGDWEAWYRKHTEII